MSDDAASSQTILVDNPKICTSSSMQHRRYTKKTGPSHMYHVMYSRSLSYTVLSYTILSRMDFWIDFENFDFYYKVLKPHDFEIAQLKENCVAQIYNDLSYTNFELH